MKHVRSYLSAFFAVVLVAGLSCPATAFSLPESSSTSAQTSAQSTSSAATSASSASSETSAAPAASAPAASSPSTSTSALTAQSASTSVSASSSTAAAQTSTAKTTDAEKEAAVSSVASSSKVDESKEGSEYAAGEVLVVFKDSAESTAAKDTLNSAVTVKEGQAESKKVVTNDTVVAKVTDGATVSQAVNELSKDPDVALVQPNYKYTLMDSETTDANTEGAAATQTNSLTDAMQAQASLAAQAVSINDPSASSQWQLSDTGYGTKCYSAWSYARADGTVPATGTAIGVAVIDTGCLTTHQDLAANIVGSYNSVSKTTGNSVVSDSVGHGTHVAGIIAASTNNGLGGSGTSYNAHVIPIKAAASDGYFYTDGLTNAYDYVIANKSTYNIRVVNMSLGGGIDSESEVSGDDALLQKIDAANAAGILTVCAAGNMDSSQGYYPPYYEYPGDYATCLSVINLTSTGSRSSSSNYNTSDVSESSSNGTKDISAPGTRIYSTYNSGNSSYAYMDGTSMASPVVAGIAALVFAANSSLAPAQVKSILEETATDLGASGWDRTYGYGEVNAEAAVKRALGADLADGGTIAAVAGQTYTGSAITPSLTVKSKQGITLTAGTDYTVSYSNNVNAGTATATVTGKGTYYGTVSTTFTINPASISAAVFAAIANQAYTGSAVTPDATVTWNGFTLAKGTDYTVSYTNNVNIGTATLTIMGTGNFLPSTSASTTFRIASNIANCTVSGLGSYVYAGSAQTPAPTVTSPSGAKLAEGTDYTLSYASNVNAGTATVTITGAGNSYAGTTTAHFTITQADISTATIAAIASRTYTGAAQMPALTVTWNGHTLASGTDYTASYSNNTNVGTATVRVAGTGNFKSSTSVGSTFQITQASISSASISGISSSYTYTGYAIAPAPTVTWGGRTLTEGTDYSVSYSNNVNVGTAMVTVWGKGNFSSLTSASASFAIAAPTLSVSTTTHVQDYGWQGAVTSTPTSVATSGTTGSAKRLEGIRITLGSTPFSGSISYSTHVQDIGWQGWVSDGQLAGTTGQSKRLEAIRIKLTGDVANHYDVYYRVHAQNVGWMDWAANGEEAGTAGYSYRLEAIQVVIMPKGASAPSASPASVTAEHFQSLKYQTHVQNVGWQDWVNDGNVSGTSGRSLRLEGIHISLGTSEYSGSINYRTQVQNIGWQGWKSDGALSGTSGRALRLEAIQIYLSGDIANYYDVYYRVHVQNVGWQGWVANGATAGTVGQSLRLEAIQIKLVPK